MKEEFDRRPLLLALFGLIIGLTLPHFPINALFLALALLISDKKLLLACAFAIGAWLAPVLPRQGIVKAVEIQGLASVVTLPTVKKFGQSCVIKMSSGQYLLKLGLLPPLTFGDEIELRGKAVPNPEIRDKWLLNHNIIGTIDLLSQENASSLRIAKHSSGLPAIGAKWRTSFLGFTQASLGEGEGDFVNAIAFNATGGLDDKEFQSLNRTGTMRFVAASGLQVVALLLLLRFMLGNLPIPLIVKQVVIASLLIVYLAATGFHPATARAVGMAIFLQVAWLFRREYDGLSALSAIGIGFLLWKPIAIYEPGFQLSMVAVAGASAFLVSYRRRSWKRHLMDGLVLWLLVTPLAAHIFGTVSFIGLFVNAFEVLLFPLLIVGIFAAYFLSFALPSVAASMMEDIMLFVQPLDRGITWASNLPIWGVEVPEFNGYWLLPYYGLLGWWLWVPRERAVD